MGREHQGAVITEAWLDIREFLRGVRRWTRRQWARSSLRNRIRLLAWDCEKSPSGLPETHFSWMSSRLHRIGRRPTLLALPALPTKHKYVLAKTLLALGWRVTNDPRTRFDVAILWQDETTIRPPAAIEALLDSDSVRVINGHCLDISKSHVARVFRETFGYGMEVDPTRHHGPCVCKSEINCARLGHMVDAPIEKPEPGMVYHRLINNVVDHDKVLDLRTYIEGGTPRVLVHKYRRVDLRFKPGPGLTSELRELRAEYTDAELTAIADFCRRIGIDHGALDILRDRDDGRLYVVDANKTPGGPSRGLSPRECRTACDVLARAFEETYLIKV